MCSASAGAQPGPWDGRAHTAALALGRVCTRESRAGFWNTEVWCFSTQLHCSSWHSSFDVEEVEPQCADACGSSLNIKGCFPQCCHFCCWNMTQQITRLKQFSHVWEHVPECTLQGWVSPCSAAALQIPWSKGVYLPSPALYCGEP